MTGVCVREGFFFRARPAGITGAFAGLGISDANDWERLSRLPVGEVEEDVGFVSARTWEVVIRRRLGGVWNGGDACARAMFWRQGRHTDPIDGNWNSERFMVAALCHERAALLRQSQKCLGCLNCLAGHRSGTLPALCILRRRCL